MSMGCSNLVKELPVGKLFFQTKKAVIQYELENSFLTLCPLF
jgi:hypothetical protein